MNLGKAKPARADQVLNAVRKLHNTVDYVGREFSSERLEEMLSPNALFPKRKRTLTSDYIELRREINSVFSDGKAKQSHENQS